MPVSGITTITGSSADLQLNASGSGFGIFSSYSAYASEALSYSSGAPIIGSGSISLSLDTSFGDLVFSGSDTITATPGSDFLFYGSDTLSFVFGSETLSFSAGGSVDGGTSFASLENDINSYYSSITSLGGVVGFSDTVSASAGSVFASEFSQIFTAATSVQGGGSVTNGSDGSVITVYPIKPT